MSEYSIAIGIRPTDRVWIPIYSVYILLTTLLTCLSPTLIEAKFPEQRDYIAEFYYEKLPVVSEVTAANIRSVEQKYGPQVSLKFETVRICVQCSIISSLILLLSIFMFFSRTNYSGVPININIILGFIVVDLFAVYMVFLNPDFTNVSQNIRYFDLSDGGFFTYYLFGSGVPILTSAIPVFLAAKHLS